MDRFLKITYSVLLVSALVVTVVAVRDARASLARAQQNADALAQQTWRVTGKEIVQDSWGDEFIVLNLKGSEDGAEENLEISRTKEEKWAMYFTLQPGQNFRFRRVAGPHKWLPNTYRLDLVEIAG